ncbi:uncharacterized protein LOC127809785 isoform X2 [Diospyros lotus]|uniref:uncharacterized protein LOC127809785 isoform X2 n=1 Tax=Diospyros lotus TaxID=55363 RepID=UPI002257B25B|nr:uncharacterized protein LOC127809785 isoform X2 [Diospyros lotus]
MIGLARCQEPSDSYMLKILTPKSELEIFTLHYGKYISHSRWCFLWRSKRKIGCGQHWTYFLGGISMKCGFALEIFNVLVGTCSDGTEVEDV